MVGLEDIAVFTRTHRYEVMLLNIVTFSVTQIARKNYYSMLNISETVQVKHS